MASPPRSALHLVFGIQPYHAAQLFLDIMYWRRHLQSMHIWTAAMLCCSAHATVAQRPPSTPHIDSLTQRVHVRDTDSSGFRLIHQDIALSNFVWGPNRKNPMSIGVMLRPVPWISGSFSGTVRNTVVVTAAHLDSLTFNVGYSLRVTRVTDERGTTVPFTLAPWPLQHILVIRLKHASATHDTVRCTIHYRGGFPPDWGGVAFIPDPGGMLRHAQEVWTETLPMGEWFPLHPTLHTRIT
jgi:hypothetical protein